MKLTDLKSQISLGEDSHHLFKRDVTNVDSSTPDKGGHWEVVE